VQFRRNRLQNVRHYLPAATFCVYFCEVYRQVSMTEKRFTTTLMNRMITIIR